MSSAGQSKFFKYFFNHIFKSFHIKQGDEASNLQMIAASERICENVADEKEQSKDRVHKKEDRR